MEFNSAALELYNQNIFGVGHEVSLRFVGHLRRQPYAGLETFYKINNIRGKFLDITAGYMNTYKREGFSLIVDKPFLIPSVTWGYGGSALRMYRTNRIYDMIPYKQKFLWIYIFQCLGRTKFSITAKSYSKFSSGYNSRFLQQSIFSKA
jgi:hypothetical protein